MPEGAKLEKNTITTPKNRNIHTDLLFNDLCNYEFLKKYYPQGKFEKYGVENQISCATVSILTNGYLRNLYNKPGMTIRDEEPDSLVIPK